MNHFLDIEIVIKHQFLDPETYNICEFLVLQVETDSVNPFLLGETGIMDERNYTN